MQILSKQSLSRHSGLIQKIAISVLILVGLVLNLDSSKLQSAIGNIRIDAWLVVIGLFYFQLLALSYRWQKLVNINEERISFGYAIKTNLVSLLANYVFITTIGGVIVRVAMNMQQGISFVKSISAAVLDRGFTLLSLVILALLFLPVFTSIVSDDILHNTAFLLITAFSAVVILSMIVFQELRRKIIFSHRKVSLCIQYMRSVFTRKALLSKVMAASLLAQIANFIAVYFIMNSMGIEFSLLHFLAIIPVITIISCLPIGYGGWGIREGAFVYGLGLIGVGFEDAFSASIQIGLISMAAAILFGVPAALKTDFKDFFSFKKIKAKYGTR